MAKSIVAAMRTGGRRHRSPHENLRPPPSDAATVAEVAATEGMAAGADAPSLMTLLATLNRDRKMKKP